MEKIKYTYANGETVEFNDFEREDHLVFKVNLPDGESNYISGNGEGIWCCASAETVNELDSGADSRKNGKKYFVKALNDSIYYWGLINYGDVLCVEARGEHRPVAILDEMKDMVERKDKCIIIKEL